MKKHFTNQFFIKNRQTLLESSEAKLLIIAANNTLQRSGDTSFPFRQDSNFWYLTGINEPDYFLVIDQQESYLIAPRLSKYQEIMETQTDHHVLKEISGINTILSSSEGWGRLREQLSLHEKVGTPFPVNVKRYYAIAPNPARTQLFRKLKRYVGGVKLDDIRGKLAEMRMTKQTAELSVIREAIDITSQTIQEVFSKDWYKKFKYEYEIEAMLNAGFRRRGSAGHAFTPIVISGNKTAVIHHFNTDDRLKEGDLIQIDVGAEVSNYGADISRVFPIGPKLTLRQAKIYEAVRETQDYALSLIRPGALIRENEKLIEQHIGKHLKRLGVISTLNTDSIRTHYPHACSHMLGLDTHDSANYDVPLAENMVLTVEPGIYLPEEGLGIRIEDDVLVTKQGAEILSKSLSRDLD